MTASSGRDLKTVEEEDENMEDGGGALPDRDLERVLRRDEGRVKERRRWREGEAADGPREGPVSMESAARSGCSKVKSDVRGVEVVEESE